MAVLIEGFSVIIKVSSILRAYNNSPEIFEMKIPNQTSCSDNELYRVGFMTPDDVRGFIESIEKDGLTYIEDEKCKDLVVVCQNEGFLANCKWAEAYKYEIKLDKFALGCRLNTGKEERLFTPDDWSYEKSLYSTGRFIPNDEFSKGITYIESEGNLDTYEDNKTGEIIYVGRTNKKGGD